VLGIWIEQNEGAKFWLKVMNEVRNRGVEDILIAVVDGLKGAKGLSGGHHHGFPIGQRADLHRAFKPLLPVLLRLEGAPGPGSRAQSHLPG